MAFITMTARKVYGERHQQTRKEPKKKLHTTSGNTIKMVNTVKAIVADANDGDRLRPLAESLLMRRTHLMSSNE